DNTRTMGTSASWPISDPARPYAPAMPGTIQSGAATWTSCGATKTSGRPGTPAERRIGNMNSLSDPALWHRIQFAFTITYHYLFPQLTMGLVWFLVYWKWRALRTGDEKYNLAARFWARIFGLNFAVGVVTGIPMEFQFGTNWA